MGQSESPERNGTRRKTLIVSLIGLLLSCLVGISLLVNHQETLRNYLPWRVQRIIHSLNNSNSSITDLRGCICASDKEVTLTREDGLKVAGSLYGLNSSEKKAGILLLHGNTPVGRNLALYRIMAKKFTEWGYIIMTIDFTGFGESDDPFRLKKEEALDMDKDVDTSLKYLRSLDELKGGQIYLVGHSMGAVPALRVGAQDSRVAGIIAIGPPRREAERLSNPQDRDYWWQRAQATRQLVYGKQFPVWYSKKVWLERTMRWEMAQYMPYFSQATHTPLLLIDGELEGEKDKLYLQKFYQSIAGAKKYVTIPGSDHYSNSLRFMGLNIYDRNVMNKILNKIAKWIEELEEH